MTTHFADRLLEACRRKGTALCVGLDPRWDLLPLEFRQLVGDTPNSPGVVKTPISPGGVVGMMYAEFCIAVLDIVAPLVAVVKPQSAFFEACGHQGFAALQAVLSHARDLGLMVILDNKRNDIASTAEAYADAVFAGMPLEGTRHAVLQADAMTINPYLGRDAVEPFLASARQVEGGVFVLVRTSNKGAGQFQDLDCGGRPLYQHVAGAVGAWAEENRGACGLGDVGAVVGATHPRELELIRTLLPHVIFLVPGYGAQGGSAADVAPAFHPDGSGAIVNSSRGIIASFRPEDANWKSAIEQATRRAIAELLPAFSPRRPSKLR